MGAKNGVFVSIMKAIALICKDKDDKTKIQHMRETKKKTT